MPVFLLPKRCLDFPFVDGQLHERPSDNMMIGWGQTCSAASLLTKTYQEFIPL